jgi:hypothetical protein
MGRPFQTWLKAFSGVSKAISTIVLREQIGDPQQANMTRRIRRINGPQPKAVQAFAGDAAAS